jgi:1,4-dihydroxy-2-naphthoate octaprenyltransferase
MTDELQRLFIAVLSTIPFMAIFVALTYRVGEFRLLPGELGKILTTFVIGYLAVLGFFVLLDALPPTFDLVLVLAAAVATVASMPIVRRRQEQFIRDQPPDQRAELEKRGAFFRSGRGRAVLVGLGSVLILWGVIVGLIFR